MARVNPIVEYTVRNYAGMPADKILDLYPIDYLDCRLGHIWPTRKDAGALHFRYVGKGLIDCTMTCKRCGYTKVMHFDNHFRRLGPDTTYYPPGYLTPKSGLTKSDFRAHSYSGLFKEADEKGLVEPYEGE